MHFPNVCLMDTGISVHPDTSFNVTDGTNYSSEIHNLRKQLASARVSAIRQRWRIFAGFALAHHFRQKLTEAMAQSKESGANSVISGTREYQEPNTQDSAAFESLPSSGTYPRELQALRQQLTEQEELTAAVRQAAVMEIERLQGLLAKESGDHAADVCELESRYEMTTRKLQTDLSHSNQAVSVLSKRYAEMKRTCKKLNFQLSDLQTREVESRALVLQVTNNFTLLNGQKQMVLDRLHELETKLAWASPSLAVSNGVSFDEDGVFSMQKRASDLDLRTQRVENCITELEDKLDLMVPLFEKVVAVLKHSKQVVSPFSCSLKPAIAAMDSGGSSLEESTTDCTDRSTSSNCCTAVELESLHTTTSQHLAEDETVPQMSDANSSKSSYQLSPSGSQLDGLKAVISGPHAPRFCRYQYTPLEQAPSLLPNPAVPCNSALHISAGASERVSSGEPVCVHLTNGSTVYDVGQQKHHINHGCFQEVNHESENRVPYLPPTSRLIDDPVVETVTTLSHPAQHFVSHCTIAHENSNELVAPQPRLSKFGQVFKAIRRGRSEIERYPSELTNHDRASR